MSQIGASAAAATGMAPYPGLTFGQLLDRSFRLLRVRLWLFAGLAAVPSAAYAFVMAAAVGIMMATILPELRRNATPDPRHVMWAVGPVVIFGFVAVIPVFAVYAAASAQAVVGANVGASVSRRQAWASAWRMRWPAIRLALLLWLLVAGPAYLVEGVMSLSLAAAGLTSTAGSAAPPAWFLLLIPFLGLFMVGACVYMVLMFLRYSLAFGALVVEQLPALAALRRSVELTRNAKGRIFLLLLVVYAAVYAAALIFEIAAFLLIGIGAIVVSLLHVSFQSPAFLFFAVPLAMLLALLFYVGIGALSYAAFSTALGVLYCDQRYRECGSLPVLQPEGDRA